jgi:hypothetical protein
MYYRFSSTIITWHNSTLRAEPSAETLKYQDYISQYEHHWWLAKPAPKSPHQPLTFYVDSKAPMLDNYFTGTLFDLYSAELIHLLQENEVRFETFPAILLDKATKTRLPTEYRVFHLLEHKSVSSELLASLNRSLDMNNLLSQLRQDHQPNASETGSEIQDMNTDKTNQDNKAIANRMFRVLEEPSVVLIDGTLQEILDGLQVTGCLYQRIGT